MGSACVQVSTGPGTAQEPHPWRQAVFLLGQPQRVCTGAMPAQRGPCPAMLPVVQEAGKSVDLAGKNCDPAAGAGACQPASELTLHADFNREACGEVHLAVDWNS